MSFCDLWISYELSCYEGEPDPKPDPKPDPNPDPKPEVFTKAQVDAYLAEERKKAETVFKTQLKTKLEQQERLYSELLTNKNLTEQERDSLRESLEAVEKELHSREDLLKREKKQVEETLSAKASELEKMAQAWQERYQSSQINGELRAAATAHEAFDVDQMLALLRPQTSMVEVLDVAGKGTGVFKVVVEVNEVVDGKPVVNKITPAEAIEKMKSNPRMANLFKSNVVSGAGADSGSGAQAGKVDWKRMTQEQFHEMCKKDPRLLGKK